MRILLLSGGVDSLVCLYLGKFDSALFIDYGQPAALVERRRSLMFASGRAVPWKVATISSSARTGILGAFDGSAVSAVVPGRNSLFVGLAAMCGASTVTLGCNSDDQGAFADCRPDVLRPVAMACGVQLEMPLMAHTKRQVVQIARELGAPFHAATTCYRGTKCGQCSACLLLTAALTPDAQ